MPRILVSALVLAVGLVGCLLGPARASGTAIGPVAEIRVQGQAYEGQYNTFRGTLRLACRPGLVVSELRLSFTQDFTSPETSESTTPTCDGQWHTHRYTSFEGYHAGPATVHVRMVLVDAATGAPRGEVTSSGSVYIRPGARVLLPHWAEMISPGVVKVRLAARCDRPWVLSDFSVSVSQFSGYAFASQRLDIPCDGTYHVRTAHLRSGGRPFAPGWVRLDASLSTLDAVNFDPAVDATATRAARVY